MPVLVNGRHAVGAIFLCTEPNAYFTVFRHIANAKELTLINSKATDREFQSIKTKLNRKKQNQPSRCNIELL